MSINFGEGELGTLTTSDGQVRYSITWDDLLWLARMVRGEVGNSRVEMATVLWTLASRMCLPNFWPRYRTADKGLKVFAQDFSQPINPKWRRDGVFCQPGGRYNGTDHCSVDKLDRRDQISNLRWDEINNNIREVVVNWAKGQIPNPAPRSIDWAAFRSTNPDLQVVWDADGNLFYSNQRSRNWPDNFVRIVYQQSVSTEDSSLQQRSNESNVSVRDDPYTPNPQNSIFERNSTLTVDRTSPPNRQYNYAALENATQTDPQAQTLLNEDQQRLVIRSHYERFYNEVQALKDATNLDFAQTAPIIQIFTQDDTGRIVNLNEKIFSKPAYQNYFDQQLDNVNLTNPERPLAGIISLQLKIESPAVGGVGTITTGILKIKIYNPSMVYEDHPEGKYISYMMRQGFYLRIRYGVAPVQDNEFAFQWKEQDFIVAQYNLNINDDKTYDLDLNIMPAADKLFNQIHVGESIPFSEFGREALTEDDIEQIIESVTAPDATQEDISALRQRLNAFRRDFNVGRSSPGFRLSQNRGRNGEITFGSVLHGAISQSRILQNNNGMAPVRIDNMVDALRTIQSVLLTRRIQSLLEQDAYRTTLKGVERNAINLGALIYRLVLPEMNSVANYISQNNLKMGEEFSIDYAEENENESSPRRSNVKLIFGNFNARAGDWAGRSISSFPINVDAIFSYLRQQRDVGQFSSTINAFITEINSNVNEPTNFVVSRESTNDEDDPQYLIEHPQIKYSFYPDPTDQGSWIMYFYDNKEMAVTIGSILGFLNEERTDQESLTKEEIIDRLDNLKIPYLEMGQEGSIIKTMSATTQADDLLMTQNLLLANQQAITARNVDGSMAIPSGISRDFMAGAQLNPQQVIRATTMIMPIEVNMTTWVIPTAILFAPIYLFFPTKQFSSVYQPMAIDHEIRDGMVQTRFVLQINLTRANRIPG